MNAALPIDQPATLFGGLSPQQFMQRHWQRRPLLVRQALPEVSAPASRSALFALAGREGVSSRLIEQTRAAKGAARRGGAAAWRLAQGPFARRALPPASRPGWTLLVQGLERHVPAARALLDRFRFVPEARLDDLMVSWASDGGGVGPHFDSYDVFLIQVHGRRRWRYGRMADARLAPGVPLKLIENFRCEHDEVLEPGDLLYLPPMWAHDGVAVGECMTCSVGFRAPRREELARELLLRMADAVDGDDEAIYADRGLAATATPGRIPGELLDFARRAIERHAGGEAALALALGEYLTEPKPDEWFEAGAQAAAGEHGVVLDAGSRMAYDERHVYLNGESWRVAGADARWLRRLADRRRLEADDVRRLGAALREQLAQWIAAGWLRPLEGPTP
jgi:50S ribosomal protein L16 3-hydroxylase